MVFYIFLVLFSAVFFLLVLLLFFVVVAMIYVGDIFGGGVLCGAGRCVFPLYKPSILTSLPSFILFQCGAMDSVSWHSSALFPTSARCWGP